MRTITLIIIHCSAVRPSQQSGVSDIDNWHRRKGWKGCGYHFVVRRDGSVETGRRLEEIGAHCVGHNRHSIGVCYEGGLNAEGVATDTRTEAQKTAMLGLLQRLHARFPKALIVGHDVFNPGKRCPCFNAAHEYSALQPPGPAGEP